MKGRLQETQSGQGTTSRHDDTRLPLEVAPQGCPPGCGNRGYDGA